MAMQTTDKLIAVPRGTAQEVIAYFKRLGGVTRWDDFVSYVQEVFAVAPKVGIDPCIAIAQAAHETNNFRSYWWTKRLNPCGLGITGDRYQNERSRVFSNGRKAARAQLAHLLLYATGKVSYPLLPGDDPRYDAYMAAYGAVAKATSIAGLARSWATDPIYATGIVKHGNVIFSNLPASKVANEIVVKVHPNASPIRAGLLLWNGVGDVRINGILFHAQRRRVTAGVDSLNIRKYATTVNSPILKIAERGTKLNVIGWVVGEEVNGENRWWIGNDHTRIWVGGTVEKP